VTIDHVALLPVYLAASAAVAVFLADLIAARTAITLTVGVLGALATATGAIVVGGGAARSAFCVAGSGCSWVYDRPAMLLAVAIATITAVALLLSVPTLARGEIPAGEYAFLLASAMTGGVALGGARDLITLIVALETLTLPLYVLVGLRRRPVALIATSGRGGLAHFVPTASSAEASVTFLLTSVVATAVTLLGASLLYAATGEVHLQALAGALDVTGPGRPLAGAGLLLMLVGLGFKVAAVPVHAWAPTTARRCPSRRSCRPRPRSAASSRSST
jgi:NADH-quinone oxidoreductase subunit N